MTKGTGESTSEGETTLKLSEICGVHPLVKDIRAETFGNLRNLPSGVLSVGGLLEIAKRLPLDVVMHKGTYVCIGGLQLYRVLQICASSGADIPVVIHPHLTRRQLEDFVRIELIVIPAFFAISKKDFARLGAVWARFSTTDLFKRILNNPGPQALAMLLDCDERSIWKKEDGQRRIRSISQGAPAPQEATPGMVGGEDVDQAAVEPNEG
jgi:hypothetical protein